MAVDSKIKLFSVAAEDYFVSEQLQKTEQEWRQELTPEQYRILRERGTEPAFSGATWDNKEPGIYRCAGCGLDLYLSETKYPSGSGWPSFYQPVAAENIALREDRGFIMTRTELLCRRCGGHLGHVFADGPPPTGQRHCINSASLEFVKRDK